MTDRLDHEWPKPLWTAYKKGRQAFKDGKSPQDCPYQDRRQRNNKITWSRAYRNAWQEGFIDARGESTE